MNFRRGFFRLWLVFSALFVIATAVVFFPNVRSEFKKAYPSWSPPLSDLDLPVACSEARGKVGDDYESFSDINGKVRCWYHFDKFKALYPEYKDLTDDQLSDLIYEKAGMPQMHPARGHCY